jgi:hypothetical protein
MPLPHVQRSLFLHPVFYFPSFILLFVLLSCRSLVSNSLLVLLLLFIPESRYEDNINKLPRVLSKYLWNNLSILTDIVIKQKKKKKKKLTKLKKNSGNSGNKIRAARHCCITFTSVSIPHINSNMVSGQHFHLQHHRIHSGRSTLYDRLSS